MSQVILDSRLKNMLQHLQTTGLYRKRHDFRHQKILNFSNNDYLSLANDTRLKKAYQIGYEYYPVGSGGSPLVSGYHPVHRQLERTFAEVLGVDDCLYFSSGYAANLSLMHLIARLNASALIDKQSHASIYDGATLAKVRFKRYHHCDITDLEKKLSGLEVPVIVTESVFSMSGQVAPLLEIDRLCTRNGVELFVDEAHAFGVMGPEGLGLAKAVDINPCLRVIPFGKAFTGSGAIIAGRKDWVDALLQTARSYIYSTAPSPALAYGLLEALEIIRNAEERRDKLNALIAYFRAGVAKSAYSWCDSSTAIQQLKIGCPHRAQSIFQALLQQSIVCFPMRQPTVSKQETGLRVILNYHHEPEDIERLFQCIHTA